MGFPVVLTLLVLACIVFALTFLRAAPDLVLLGGLTLLLVFEVVSPEAALKGCGNEGLITVGVLFVVAEGLRQTGGISVLGQKLLGHPRSLLGANLRVLPPAAAMSGFMNNTPVVAMLLPVINDWSKKIQISVSHLLMPLSFATILGGMCTLVGTSTTLVVNGLLIDTQQQALADPDNTPLRFRGLDADHLGLRMFEIAAVGLPATVAGLAFILAATRWLLPARRSAVLRLEDPREYTTELIVEAGSPLVGKTIEEAGLRHLPHLYLVEIEREGHVLAAVAPNERLHAKDRLVFVGIVESVVELQRIPGLSPATNQLFKLEGPRSERSLVEAVVSNSCPFLRMTIREARFRTHYNAAVIAVARNGERIQKKIGDIELIPGDTLLLEAPPGFITLQRNSRDFFLISQVQDSTPPRHDRAWIARLILAAMVISVATGLLSMLKSAMLAAGLMIITRCCRGSEARRSVDWGVLLTIAAGLGIGEALKAQGTDRLLADALIGTVGDNPTLVLGVVYALTMIFTNIITAKAAAVLFFPIAMAAAINLQVNPMPFAVAVMMSAAASFATPIGYQTNLMVYGPGGYRFTDFMRLGGPLSLIVALITLIIAPIIWPF